eukprot:726752-Pelagomonas_calceolata.AAC.2
MEACVVAPLIGEQGISAIGDQVLHTVWVAAGSTGCGGIDGACGCKGKQGKCCWKFAEASYRMLKAEGRGAQKPSRKAGLVHSV